MVGLTLRSLFLAAAVLVAAPFSVAEAQVTAPHFAPHELDSLVAPIALYPDGLLADVLMAATYPLEVVEAERWLNQSGNANLAGDRLMQALDAQTWDPSVKALTAVPPVLRMMDSRLDWMDRLGAAFISDQAQVMDAVQRLRRQARANGSLRTDNTHRVIENDGVIIIEPASAQSLSLDVYEPATVYGTWQYPEYPPIYIEPPPDYLAGPIIAYPLIVPLWGWSTWDWRRHHLDLNVPRWRNLDRNRSHVVIDNRWEHDPSRLRGGGSVLGALPSTTPSRLPPGLTPGDPRRGTGQGPGRRDDHDGVPGGPRRAETPATPSTLAPRPNMTNAAPSVPAPSVTPSAPGGTPPPKLDPGRFRHDGDRDHDGAPIVRPNRSASPPGVATAQPTAPVAAPFPRTPGPPRAYVPPTPPPSLSAPVPAPYVAVPQRPAQPAAGEPKVVCSPGTRCAQP